MRYRLGRVHFEYQFYWPRWWLLYINHYPDDFGPTIWVIAIGPFQARWFCT